ncbi:FAD-dependent oxidoreductase [Rhizobium sp. 1AS11]|uniref:FAD-dependent oxidoreductase n=1 Tax=Rhizobium acaciae TaxID=2989736 RepID=UPI002223BAFD|nr:FAD-dependent oxidoreductase [Rhizobium acaciae]MCW1411853.1 FAD-dependent oxidoreductase [Rhizobium acaciae]MCW1744003.1 FAD-dependent oxidoreductase [Rhizobium acaciae]
MPLLPACRHHRRRVSAVSRAQSSSVTLKDIDVTLIDRRNRNLFQPLLYQVATAAPSPADISEPNRKTLARFKNFNMIMAEVVGVDPSSRSVLLSDGGSLSYDQLVIATGSDYNYFGHDVLADVRAGLKSTHEASSRSVTPSGGTSIPRLCFMDMSNTEQRATKGMVKLGLTIFVVAVIIAVANLAFFTPGKF